MNLDIDYYAGNLEPYTPGKTRVVTGGSLSRCKTLGYFVKKFDGDEIELIAAYSGSLRQDFYDSLVKHGIIFNNDDSSNYFSIKTGDDSNVRFMFKPENMGIEMFLDKKEYTAKTKELLSKDELVSFKDNADKMKIACELSILHFTESKLKGLKGFKEEFLKDELFVKYFLDTIESEEKKGTKGFFSKEMEDFRKFLTKS